MCCIKELYNNGNSSSFTSVNSEFNQPKVKWYKFQASNPSVY